MTAPETHVGESEQPPVGIDLGTTYSVVAYIDASGRPVTICNGSGDLLTPSALLFDDDGIAVGKEAVKGCLLAPESYVECFKRDMGRAAARRRIRGFEAPPEVLSAFILERLKQDAEKRLGPIRRAVITVPAFFDETRRRATQDAARLVDLEVLDIINEPTAAALAYGHYSKHLRDADQRGRPERILVYDLGGGTFDVTILEIHNSKFRTLATDGDVFLGGKDFDERLVDHLATQFMAAQGVDPRSDPQDAARLWLDAQEAKHSLSERTKTTVVCFHAGIRMRVDVTRAEFEEITRDLLERTETTTSLVVRQAGFTWDQIDRVLLVGGSSRMPMIGAMLQRVTGKAPDCSQSPDEAVAHGAALYAGMLMATKCQGASPTCELINVNSHSLGVVATHQRTGQKQNVILIPKNSPLPCKARRVFKTARDDQRSVKVQIVEGESERPEACIALGQCVVRDLPTGLPKSTVVEVEYSYGANGRVSVMARVPSVRYSKCVEIHRDSAESFGDLTTWRCRLCGHGDFPAAISVDAASQEGSENPTKRLDTLYRAVGKLAMNGSLSPPLSGARAVVAEAEAALTEAQAKFNSAQQARLGDSGSGEVISLAVELAKATTALHAAQARADFAYLVLGRQCINAGFEPAGAETLCADIRRIMTAEA